MTRADRKRGRWSRAQASATIDRGLRAWATKTGDALTWYRYAPETSQADDVYDEGTGRGRIFWGPITVPLLSAYRDQGQADRTEQGLYQVAPLQVTASLRQMERVGLTAPDLYNYRYLRDWIGYDGRLFRIEDMQVLGRLNRRDTVVAMTFSEIKADELTSDPLFKAYRDFHGRLLNKRR
ncbi:hypothetical protein [Streptomyces sp. UNOC14_S4]|uniref:hypothetical protein n=1 Tax=Streptomyces sp. UNOC14_S4 TaxID=2872340 RepID=UPI001E4ADFF3|nr:hypothetical protein [Streptomyces sp. UNOC14_S4]MCC3766044.1 hypothetical protein [Streptomyces sp. UNOC14_S4]